MVLAGLPVEKVRVTRQIGLFPDFPQISSGETLFPISFVITRSTFGRLPQQGSRTVGIIAASQFHRDMVSLTDDFPFAARDA